MMIRALILCLGVAWAGVAAAAPKVNPKTEYRLAAAEHAGGNYQKALEHIDKGLAAAPKDLKLLGLKGAVLIELRDYPRALAAYRTYLAAGVAGANRREAQKIVDKLLAVESTFLEVTIANGPADVYLDTKTLGAFCRAAPTCKQPVLPDQYKVIVERPGFRPWTGEVTVETGKATPLAVTLTELPSPLAVRVEPAGARVAVDGAPLDGPGEVAAGRHQVVVSLAGHLEARREIEARGGEPIELVIALVPLVPFRVQPPGAELLLDGKPAEIRGDRVAIPPGTHNLVARAPGFQDLELEIPAVRGADYQLTLELEPARPVAAASDEAAARPGRFTFRRKLALAVGGAGLLAAGGGVWLGVRANQVEDDGTIDADQRRDARRLQSHLAYGAAGLAVAVAIGLWIDGAPGKTGSTPRVAVSPRLGAGAGLDLAVRF